MEMRILRCSSSGSVNSARKKHIVFISYYFPPMGGGGVQRIVKFLKYFDYRRYTVSVLTVKPSYYYTYDETLEREIPPDVQIIRSESLDPFRFIYIFQRIKSLFQPGLDEKNNAESSGWIRKIAMSFFIPDSRLLWLPFALIRLWHLHRLHPIDLIISTMPPFTAGLIGVLFQQWRGVPVVLDFRDAWTENPYLPKVGRWQRKLSAGLESYCLSRTRGAIFVNPALQEYYLKKYPPLLQKPCQTVRNGYDQEDFKKLRSSQTPISENLFTLGIIGTIYSQGNRPYSLITAVKQLSQEIPGFDNRFKLIFLGKWATDFLEQVKLQDMEDIIQFITYLPHQLALQRAKQFDAFALTIESQFSGSENVTPGRIYEYLNLRKPILAICPAKGDLARLIRRCKAGEVVEDDQVDRIKSILQDWVENRHNLDSRYQFLGIREFSRKNQTRFLLNFLQKSLFLNAFSESSHREA